MASPRSDRLRAVVADAGVAVSTKGAQMARDAPLDGVPRYRQRVETIPFLGHPVWVDDTSFNPAGP